jgi:anti-sigma regulatory factor (Ser/Thr protein kinase)
MVASPVEQQVRETRRDPGDSADIESSPDARFAMCAVQCSRKAPRQAREFIGVLLRHWGVAEDAADDMRIIVSELVTNVVVHSGSPEVTVAVTLHGHTVCLSVRDFGHWRRPRRDPTGTHGRGLTLVRRLATTSGTHRTPGGTHAWAQLVPSRV